MARQALVLMCTALIAGPIGVWAVYGDVYWPALVAGLVLLVLGAVWVRGPRARAQ